MKFSKLVLVGVLVFFSACDNDPLVNFVKKFLPKKQTTENQVVKQVDQGQPIVSYDGISQIIPSLGWAPDHDLNERAEIEASNLKDSLYFISLTEKKSDFASMSLDQHSETTRGLLVSTLSNAMQSGPVRITINGQPAVQYEIMATSDNTHVAYLHTTIETPAHYHQLLAWTLQSKFAEKREELNRITQSFKEIK